MSYGITATAKVVQTLGPTGAKWKAVALLATGLAMDYLARLAVYSVLPLLRKELVTGNAELALLASAFPWTYGLLSPLAGYAGDRFPRRTVVIGSLGTWSFVTMLTALGNSAWQLIAMRVALAAAQVCYMPTAQALIADFHNSDTRAKASGLYQAGSYIGIFLAGFPAAYLSTHFGWRCMLLICGAVGLLIALIMWQRLPSVRAQRTDTSVVSIRQALSLGRKPSLLAIAAAFSLASASYWLLFTYLPLFVYERYHLSLEAAAFQATFYVQISAMISMPLLGAVSDAWAARNPLNRFITAAFVSAAGIPALVAIGAGTHTAVLVCALVVFGFVMAGADASWLPMLCMVALPRQRATAYGMLNTAGTLAGAVTAMITGLVMKRLGLAFVITSMGVVYGFIVAALLMAGHMSMRREAVQGAYFNGGAA